MVSEHWPTYVVLTLYVLTTATVTIIAKIKNMKGEKQESDVISTHFLASKNFGSIILFFTTFASVFSGYTVVGVPNECGNTGFIGIRWMPLTIVVGVSMLWCFPRLRRLSVIRGYVSPGDFIADRFQSKTLSILIALCVSVPQILYIGINLFSLGSIIDSLTDGELSFYIVVSISFIMILLFESLGGIRSVAYTDTVESLVMVFIWILIPCIIAYFYNSFIGMVNNSESLTIPCDNSNMNQTNGCLNYVTNNIADEYFLRTPSRLTIINYLLFTFSVISFSLNPHLTQRVMTAKHDSDVRCVIICIFLSTFIAMVPGVLIGITYLSNYKNTYGTVGAYQTILLVFRDKGGFVAAVSYIALLAAIAGIMSTADSALIGVSNTISCDIFKNWIFTKMSPRKIVLIGKFTSFCTMCFALGLSIVFWEVEADYAVIYTLQQGILWQAVPCHIFGLYSNMKTNSVLLGLIVGITCDIILITIVFSDNDPFLTYDPSLTLDKSWSTYIGTICNLIGCIIGHYCIWKPLNDEIDNNYDTSTVEYKNNRLTSKKIEDIMKGITEPVTKYYGLFSWLTLVLIVISAFHWVGKIDPFFVETYSEQQIKSFAYNGFIRSVIVGLPDWVFASFMWYIASILCGIYAATLWTVDVEYQETVPDIVTNV